MAQIEDSTWYNYKTTTADGKEDVQQHRSKKQFEEAQADAAKVGSVIEVLMGQTFRITSAETIEEFLRLVPNPAVALSHANYGLKLAQQNFKRDWMKDATNVEQEGAIDCLSQPDVQEEREKRVADPMVAARKTMRNLWAKFNPGAPAPTDDEINAVLAQFTATSVAGAAGA